MVIYLMRHAESEGNKSVKFNGVTDTRLSENGRHQATLLGSFFKDIKLDKIYTSELKRTNETAALALPGRKNEFIKKIKLNEIDGGDWEGVEWSTLEVKWPDQYHKWREEPHLAYLPNGESVHELYERSVKVLHDIALENSDDSTIAIFSHGTVLKAIIAYIHKLPLEALKIIAWYENSSVTKIIYANNTFSLEFSDNHKHLPKSIKTVANSPWGNNMKLTCKY